MASNFSMQPPSPRDLSIGTERPRPFLCVREERPRDLAFAGPAKFPSRLLLRRLQRSRKIKNYRFYCNFIRHTIALISIVVEVDSPIIFKAVLAGTTYVGKSYISIFENRKSSNLKNLSRDLDPPCLVLEDSKLQKCLTFRTPHKFHTPLPTTPRHFL